MFINMIIGEIHRGGGPFTKLSVGGPAHEKWFCKNEGSKRSNNSEKGDQPDRKSRRKLVQIASKVSNDRFFAEKIDQL